MADVISTTQNVLTVNFCQHVGSGGFRLGPGRKSSPVLCQSFPVFVVKYEMLHPES